MDSYEEILMLLGGIKAELVQIRKLSERVCALEQMQSWMKGGWTILLVLLAYLLKASFGK
jgi:hypothetical protein